MAKKVLFIFICVSALSGFFLLNQETERESQKIEQKMIAILKEESFKESIIKVKDAEKNVFEKKDPLKEEAKVFLVESHGWNSLTEIFPEEAGMGQEKLREKTIIVLDLIQTMEEKNSAFTLVSRPEVLLWLKELNKDPGLAKDFYSRLLSQEEITGKDHVVAKLLELSEYSHFDKSALKTFAIEIIEEGAVPEYAVKANEIDGSSKILKMKAAVQVILSHENGTEEKMVKMAHELLEKRPHPLLRNDIINAVRVLYPDGALSLEEHSRETSSESINRYVASEMESVRRN